MISRSQRLPIDTADEVSENAHELVSTPPGTCGGTCGASRGGAPSGCAICRMIDLGVGSRVSSIESSSSANSDAGQASGAASGAGATSDFGRCGVGAGGTAHAVMPSGAASARVASALAPGLTAGRYSWAGSAAHCGLVGETCSIVRCSQSC